MKPKVLSFFSGAMGLDLGLEAAGFETVLACEIDKASRLTISKNRPDIPLLGDLWNYSAEDILDAVGLKPGEIDLMAGGPPCQAFSTAGRRRGFSDPRGNVFLKYLELIGEIRPHYVLLENVRGLLSSVLEVEELREDDPMDVKKAAGLPGSALLRAVRQLEGYGYAVSFNLYNAANFGTPQKRERLVLLGALEGSPIPYLTPTHSEDGRLGLEPWVSLKAALEGLAPGTVGSSFPAARLKYYELLTAGQNWRDLPQEVQREAMGRSYFSGGGKTGFYRRLSWTDPSPTLVTSPTMPATDLAHPVDNRPLNVAEYKRIQQFPDDWEILGSVQNQYRQIGNAVPVGLGKAIGEAILAHMSGEIRDDPFPDTRFSRYRRSGHLEWIDDLESKIATRFSAFN